MPFPARLKSTQNKHRIALLSFIAFLILVLSFPRTGSVTKDAEGKIKGGGVVRPLSTVVQSGSPLRDAVPHEVAKAEEEARRKQGDTSAPLVHSPGNGPGETSLAHQGEGPFAHIHTTVGDIVFKLRPDAAPKTVANFIRLSEMGFYAGTSFYRYEANFVLQGGAWPKKSSPLPPVPLEYKLPNKKYFVSTARTADPDSATSEFSIMINDNAKWLGPGGGTKEGYAVFAEVVGGIDTIEKFAKFPTKKDGLTLLKPPISIAGIDISNSEKYERPSTE